MVDCLVLDLAGVEEGVVVCLGRCGVGGGWDVALARWGCRCWDGWWGDWCLFGTVV